MEKKKHECPVCQKVVMIVVDKDQEPDDLDDDGEYFPATCPSCEADLYVVKNKEGDVLRVDDARV